jgi:hypothetical protein
MAKKFVSLTYSQFSLIGTGMAGLCSVAFPNLAKGPAETSTSQRGLDLRYELFQSFSAVSFGPCDQRGFGV